MSGETKRFKLKVTFPVVLITVFFLHASLFVIQAIPLPAFNFADYNVRRDAIKLNIRPVKTPRIAKPIGNQNLPVREVKSHASAPKKGDMSFKDLAGPNSILPSNVKIQRPGARPEVVISEKAIKQISMQDRAFKDFAKSYPSGMANIDSLDTGAFKISDATIGIENPNGVEPDELNENELVYYGFQKRMLVGYINTIVKQIEKFHVRHRNFSLDRNARIHMTARLTYDSEGNVKQIKMIRWTHLDEIQGVFEESMKNLNKLNNPPKDLWTKSGEFNVFYSWVITSG